MLIDGLLIDRLLEGGKEGGRERVGLGEGGKAGRWFPVQRNPCGSWEAPQAHSSRSLRVGSPPVSACPTPGPSLHLVHTAPAFLSFLQHNSTAGNAAETGGRSAGPLPPILRRGCSCSPGGHKARWLGASVEAGTMHTAPQPSCSRQRGHPHGASVPGT